MSAPSRRDVLGAGAALGGVAALPAGAAPRAPVVFPEDFRWGVATAAYQVEGAVAEDGRGPSIWDTFSHTPGKTKNGDTGDVACDQYHRFAEDIAIMRRMGVTSYRFSVAWPRIQPSGRGPANQKGLDHYRRLVDALLAAGIRPFPTLYHWDLPQPLEDAGGWPVRDTAARLVEYARIVVGALGDRVSDWAVLNEPKTFTQVGYWIGAHAPGRKDPLAFLKASHTANLAQGMVTHALKADRPRLRIGSAYDVSPCFPATPGAADRAAAERWHAFTNLGYLQTTLTGRYPRLLPADRQEALLGWRAGDEALLKAPLDFVGINYYSGWRVRAEPDGDIPGLRANGEWAKSPRATGRAANGWDIDAPGLYEILTRLHPVTGAIPIEITENGTADNTLAGAAPHARDAARIAYLRAHLSELHRAMRAGVPVRGYHQWSLLDNFEWGEGYSQRFGLVEVDFAGDLTRTVKNSGLWYADVARTGRVA